MANPDTIAVTGATGQLGRLVIAQLRILAPQAHIIGLVRDPAKAQDLADLGVELRVADYDAPDTLAAALARVGMLLLISSSAVGQRIAQHGHVIDAAKAAGVALIAYTSILRADTSPMALATEHLATERLIRASGIPFVLLRNGWYTENHTGSIGAALKHHVVLGAAGTGRISGAARADYAAAAAIVLIGGDAHSNKVYELAGDTGFTLADYAAEVAAQSGRPVVYRDLPEADYAAALREIGLPAFFADLLAESDTKAAAGSLEDDGRQLSALIGRPTTPLADTVRAALAALG
jgi:NAD(P)H dehydrogenase (quinone)